MSKYQHVNIESEIDRIRAKNAANAVNPLVPSPRRVFALAKTVYVPPKPGYQRPVYDAPGCVIRSPLDREELA